MMLRTLRSASMLARRALHSSAKQSQSQQSQQATTFHKTAAVAGATAAALFSSGFYLSGSGEEEEEEELSTKGMALMRPHQTGGQKGETIYEVNCHVDKDVADDFKKWLKGHYVDLLEVDGFRSAEML